MAKVNKVIVRIAGGLGNQLFLYAASRRLALVNNAELVIDHVSGFVYDTEYARSYQLEHFQMQCRCATVLERLEPFSRVRRYLKRRLNQSRDYAERSFIRQEGHSFDPRLLQIQMRGTIYLEGYWQSEAYFRDVSKTIRDDLCFRQSPTDVCNQKMLSLIRNSSAVALHMRFYEAPGQSQIYTVSSDYYIRAVAMMERLAPGSHYFVFSDRPDAARSRIPLPENRVTLVSHNLGDDLAYADLWLMTQCQHFIIANSTFSWWGAWLASNRAKVVIQPSARAVATTDGHWEFDTVVPKGWLVL
jgi:hypothetical protein